MHCEQQLCFNFSNLKCPMHKMYVHFFIVSNYVYVYNFHPVEPLMSQHKNSAEHKLLLVQEKLHVIS